MATIEIEVNMTELLGAVWDNINRNTSSWVYRYSFDSDNNDGTEQVVITFENPYGDSEVTTVVTPEALLTAFSGMVGKTIWGSTVSSDPGMMDALQADYCLQMAIFGEEIYS